MYPILFDINGALVGSYGVMVALGILVAGACATRAADRAGMDVGRSLSLMAVTLGGGFAGSALAFVAVEVARTGALPPALGLVFYGAIPGGLGAALIAARPLRIDAIRLLDLSVPGLAAGHAMGRLGCFFGGCCYGRPFDGPWAIVYEDPRAPAAQPHIGRHPAPLYESAGLLALALVFALLPPRRTGGSRALAYLGAYSALRIVVELFRGDAVRGVWGSVSTSQLVAALGIAAAIALSVRAAKRR